MNKKLLAFLLMFVFGVITNAFIISKAEIKYYKLNNKFYLHTSEIKYEVKYTNVKGTVYHAVQEQTDDSPLYTADNSFIDIRKTNELRWVALSRDLIDRNFIDHKGKKHIWSGSFKFGDTLWVDYDVQKLRLMATHKRNGFNQKQYNNLVKRHEKIKGFWVVKDVMGICYYKKNRCGEFVLNKKGNKIKVNIKNSIDFLQNPKSGVLDMWDKSLIITKKVIE